MSNPKLQELFLGEPAAWNRWRTEHPEARPNFSGANFSGRDLRGRMLTGGNFYRANFSGSCLQDCKMEGAYFTEAKFDESNLSNARLLEANLFRASLVRANCAGAKIVDANLREADFRNASLRGAILNWSQLVKTDFTNADLSDCRIYGTSAWDLALQGAIQTGIVISNFDEPTIACDNIEIAQFLHLLLNNGRLRGVIDTITSKVVLILGRFSADQLVFLQSLRSKLRQLNYVPVLFDFERPANRDLTETVSTIAHLSRFVIADISEPRSVPQELMAFSRNLLSVPIQPLLRGDEVAYGMFADFQRQQNFLPVHTYNDLSDVDLTALVERAEQRASQLRPPGA